MKIKRPVNQLAGLLQDLAFFAKTTGDKHRAKALGKAARELKAKTKRKEVNSK